MSHDETIKVLLPTNKADTLVDGVCNRGRATRHLEQWSRQIVLLRPVSKRAHSPFLAASRPANTAPESSSTRLNLLAADKLGSRLLCLIFMAFSNGVVRWLRQCSKGYERRCSRVLPNEVIGL